MTNTFHCIFVVCLVDPLLSYKKNALSIGSEKVLRKHVRFLIKKNMYLCIIYHSHIIVISKSHCRCPLVGKMMAGMISHK